MIFNLSKRKDCNILLLWQKSVINTIWYALGNNIGNPARAKHVILSILHHVTNSHVFPSLPLYGECAHDPLTEEREWLDPGTC